ncbi:MAG: tRNA (adenine-N1)-methyltransferase [Actinobacteria bacterium]|nr:tRNA (adenine-N1)-methyltransferase [Actinomycetota bacterium]
MSSETAVFAVGDRVQLSDTKGRKHTVVLEAGREFHTNKGAIAHDDLIGKPEGITVTSTGNYVYLALRPLLSDFVLSMPRGAAVIYPKDAAAIVGLADIYPDAVVAEAGVGSGALSCSLLRAIGTDGHLYSFERREEFAAVAQKNVTNFFGERPGNWTVEIGSFEVESDRLAAGSVDRIVLDMLAPWECVAAVTRLLRPGGVLVAYVATTTQMSKFVETVRLTKNWTDPVGQELIVRNWHLEGLAVRPSHKMQGHTGFLVVTRRLADGTVLPPRRIRPSKGLEAPEESDVSADLEDTE